MLAVVITGVLLYLIGWLTFSITQNVGYGMTPTLENKDIVFVNRLAKKRRFSIVSIDLKGRQGKSIQRIIGLPGDDIQYKDNQLFVNGQLKEEKGRSSYFPENYLAGQGKTEDFDMSTLTKQEMIPESKYLVLGDNREYAIDSRYFGLVDEKEIIGVVEYRIRD